MLFILKLLSNSAILLNLFINSSLLILFCIVILELSILIFIILILNKDYFSPLFNNILGIFAIILALILYTIYILVIRKILKVEV